MLDVMLIKSRKGKSQVVEIKAPKRLAEEE